MSKRFVILLMALLIAGIVSAANRKFTLVIDPGHGGRDPGCIGKISKEKDISLRYGLAIGEYIQRNCPDVKVIYTRKTDKFIALKDRADFANSNKADLFISIHVNALQSGKTARGVQTFTLGRGRVSGKKTGILENLEVAKRENSVILLEKDYKQTYQGFDPNSPESNIMFEFIQDTNMERSVELARFMQKDVCSATGRQDMGAHQDNLAVLRLSSMPGCLLELGFISTPDEEQFLAESSSVERYAKGVYRAFLKYKNKFANNIVVPYKANQKEIDLPDIVPDNYKDEASAKSKKQEQKREQLKEQKKKEQEKSANNKKLQKEETKQQETEFKSSVAPLKSETVNPDAPVFKVQILVSGKKLSEKDRQFKGVEGIEFYEEGGMVKYTVGSSANYNEIYRLRKQLLEKFPEAFIIAFKNEKKCDVREAIKEFKNSRNK